MMKPTLMKLFAFLFVLGAMTSTAAAVELTLDQGRLYQATPSYGNGGMGSGRGLGFRADEDFSMSTFAMDLSVPVAEAANEYTFEIFSSIDGHSAGGLLASTTFFLAEYEGYQPQLFDFSFVAGNFYVINFSRVDNQTLAQLGVHYSWEDEGVYVPYDYGVLTLLEGYEGADPDPSNPLIPHVRFDGESVVVPPTPPTPSIPVPTLSEWALITLTMLLGLMVFANRRRLF